MPIDLAAPISRLVQHTNKPTVTPTRRPCQAPKQSHFVLYSDKSRATSRRSVRMNSSSSHQSITISTLQESFQCNVLQPASVSETNSALILLSDIFGCSTSDTLKISQVFADELGWPVYVPDLFRGTPWPEGKPVKGSEGEYEQWRASTGGTWSVDVVKATGEHIASSCGAQNVALIGFCFGGGKVVEVLAAAGTPAHSPAPNLSCSLGGLKILSSASFYGTRINREYLGAVRSPLALYFASEDPLVPLTDVQDFRKVLEERLQTADAPTAGHTVAAAVVHVEQGQSHGFVHQAGKGSAAVADRVRGMAVEFIQHYST